ncbi:MAG TPA: hypothetical protein VND62_06330 [Acidimicrobiales bacterium]|nr:hypothetical protein [Acidimicrobiales bacterium]
MTARPLLTGDQRKRYAIARTRERRADELAPLLAQVDRSVAEVGWRRARAVVADAMAPVRVTGPRGAWRRRMGKRTGARILAGLSTLPVQGRLPLNAQPGRTLTRERKPQCTS